MSTSTPTCCPPELRQAVASMLEELECFRLQVALIPAPEQRHCGHSVRTVFQANPGWYRDLAATYQRRRRTRADRYVDPLFKREDVLRTLRRLLSVGTRSYLAGPLLAAADRIHNEQLARAASLQAERDMALASCWPWDLPADAAGLEVRL